jgi:uncharacterized coiled-coil protein SlyX
VSTLGVAGASEVSATSGGRIVPIGVRPKPQADAAPAEPAAAPTPAPSQQSRRDAARIAELEAQLRTTVERLGRRTSELNAMQARLPGPADADAGPDRGGAVVVGGEEADASAAERDDADASAGLAAAVISTLNATICELRETIALRDATLRDRDTRFSRLEREHAAALAEIRRIQGLLRPRSSQTGDRPVP